MIRSEIFGNKVFAVFMAFPWHGALEEKAITFDAPVDRATMRRASNWADQIDEGAAAGWLGTVGGEGLEKKIAGALRAHHEGAGEIRSVTALDAGKGLRPKVVYHVRIRFYLE